MQAMQKSFLLGVLTLLTAVAVACNGGATPLPEPSPDADVATATPASAPDLPATVAAEVKATITVLSTPTQAPTEAPTPVPAILPALAPTPTPEPQVPPTATPLPPAVAETTTPILPAAAAAVQLAPDSVSLEEGETRQLESVVEDGAGNPLGGRSVAWSSSNSAVAQVSGTGQVTGVSAGVANVTASVEGVWAMATIEVGHGQVASVEIVLGSGAQLVAILRDAASHLLQDRTVTWSSSDPGVVDVEAQTGRLTVGAVGVATVTATAEGVNATASVTTNPCYGVMISPKHGENSDVLLLRSVCSNSSLYSAYRASSSSSNRNLTV